MYGIFTYMYHKNQLNVGKYNMAMHGSYLNWNIEMNHWKGEACDGFLLHSPATKKKIKQRAPRVGYQQRGSYYPGYPWL